ncbi:MAG: pyruvate synthase [Nitrososphaeraceae archaeon]|nr:pyruvate synthase [Nitrososphaeraceae archaeon]
MKLTEDLVTGNKAAAIAVKLCNVDYIPAYPITPQTEIIEILSRWVLEKKLDAKFVMFESEHSMVTAAGAASLSGVRTFTATSSQGLLYATEMLYNVVGWRSPFVLANVSRGVSSPITLLPDHNDVLSIRDTGFIQIHAETCQDVLDSIIMGYRISEDPMVNIPVLVNLDGFYLSYTREKVDIPDSNYVSEFLPEYIPVSGYINAKNASSLGVAVLDSSAYSYFRYQLHLTTLNVLKMYGDVSKNFEKIFGRKYDLLEGYMLDDADYVIVITNSFSTIAKEAVDRLRKEYGKNVGLLKIRMIRPFPSDDIWKKLAGKKGVAVIDQNISVGGGGILYPEIVSSLYNKDERPETILSFIGGLGGKKITFSEFRYIISVLEEAVKGNPPISKTMLLFTENDWNTVKDMLKMSGKEVE